MRIRICSFHFQSFSLYELVARLLRTKKSFKKKYSFVNVGIIKRLYVAFCCVLMHCEKDKDHVTEQAKCVSLVNTSTVLNIHKLPIRLDDPNHDVYIYHPF